MLFGSRFLNLSVCGLAGVLMAAFAGCTPTPSESQISNEATTTGSANPRETIAAFKDRLSEYELFQQPMAELKPAPGVMEYELNTPLFSDYSLKQRLIKLPEGSTVEFREPGPLEFPIGTVIAKTFYYVDDLSRPSHGGRNIIETRILELRDDGWTGIAYVWNEDQTDARRSIAGASAKVSWSHGERGLRENVHQIPNFNDCKRCHSIPDMQPIGPKANNLNRDFKYPDGAENQLVHWSKSGFLAGLSNLDDVSRLVAWDDETASINDRARAYLDVNCAHCHSARGPARNSGLYLNVEETDRYRLGVFKTPVAAGKGTGGRRYGIVPSKPDESILEYRMWTTEPGEIMPEFGKSLVHEEAHALIRQWIAEMKP